MTKFEREAEVERLTGKKIWYSEIRRQIIYYYCEDDCSLMAKYHIKSGKLEIMN